jgi:LmbE family N-acetylglucosaminyl deacetylase
MLLAVASWLPAVRAASPGSPESVPAPLPPFGQRDRVLVIAPHPDDEVVGCGGAIQVALKAKAKVRVLVITNGDAFTSAVRAAEGEVSPEAHRRFGETRRLESLAALKSLGLPSEQVTHLGYPDCGVAAMMLTHWVRPYRSPRTATSICPYAPSPRYERAYTGLNLLRDLEGAVLDFRPTAVFVPDPSDFNEDHWAVSCLAQVAVERVEAAQRARLQAMVGRPHVLPVAPEVWGYLVHFGSYPSPRGSHPSRRLVPQPYRDPWCWRTCVSLSLTASQAMAKARAIELYQTQRYSRYERTYLDAFAAVNEPFRRLGPERATGSRRQQLEHRGDLRRPESTLDLVELAVRLDREKAHISLRFSGDAGDRGEAGITACWIGDDGRHEAWERSGPITRGVTSAEWDLPLPEHEGSLMLCGYTKQNGLLSDRSDWRILRPGSRDRLASVAKRRGRRQVGPRPSAPR